MTGLTPSELLAKVREVVERERVKDRMVELSEDGTGYKCAPVKVSHRGSFWALQVRSNDHLRLLFGSREDSEKSFCKLPDYLVFAEPRARKRKGGRGPDLLVLVCELKSSAAGVAGGARRQVRLGKFLAEYLVRLGMFAAGCVKEEPLVDICGLVVSPSYPSQVRARSATRADEDAARGDLDVPSDMLVYTSSGDEELFVEDFFG